MRKDNSLITSALLPEKQETIGKLADIQRTRTQIAAVDEEVSNMNAMLRKTVQVNEEQDYENMVAKVLAYETITNLQAATTEQIDEILTDSNGNNIEFHGMNKISADEMADLRRDYVEFIFNSNVEFKRLEETRTELDAEWVAMDEEFKDIFESMGGDMTTYINNLLEESQAALQAKAELTPEEQERLAKTKLVLRNLDQAVRLEDLIEYVAAFDARNIINDYKHRSEDIGTRYGKACKKINLSLSLLSFRNIERLFIADTRFHKHSDLFTFIVMRYFSYKKNVTAYDGILLSQLAFELRQLYTKDPAKLTEKEQLRRNLLTGSIERVLTVVYDKLGL